MWQFEISSAEHLEAIDKVHHYLTNQPIKHDNRRRSPRHFAGAMRVKIAVLDDQFLTGNLSFSCVQCYDISASGVALIFADHIAVRENCRYLIRLTMGQNQTCDVIARLRRLAKVYIDPKGMVIYPEKVDSAPKSFDPEKAQTAQLAGFEFLRKKI